MRKVDRELQFLTNNSNSECIEQYSEISYKNNIMEQFSSQNKYPRVKGIFSNTVSNESRSRSTGSGDPVQSLLDIKKSQPKSRVGVNIGHYGCSGRISITPLDRDDVNGIETRDVLNRDIVHNREIDNCDASNSNCHIDIEKSNDGLLNEEDTVSIIDQTKEKEKENQIPSPPPSLLPPIQSSLPLLLTQSRTLLLTPHTRHNTYHISKKKSRTQHLLTSPHMPERGLPAGAEGEGREKSTTSKVCTVVSTGLPANAEPALFSVYEKKKKMKNDQISLSAEDCAVVHSYHVRDTSRALARVTSIKDRIYNLMRERKENILHSDFRGQNPGVFDFKNGQLGDIISENNSRARIPGVKTWEKQNSLIEGEWAAIPGSRRISKHQSNGGHNPGVIFPKRNSFMKQKKRSIGPEESLSLKGLLPLNPTGVLFRDFPSFPPLVSAG
jgi:hypothetical protein